jgi:hypothetical protein
LDDIVVPIFSRFLVVHFVASTAFVCPTHSLSGVSFSFNGGKDSTVLLHVLRSVVCRRGQPADIATASEPERQADAVASTSGATDDRGDLGGARHLCQPLGFRV